VIEGSITFTGLLIYVKNLVRVLVFAVTCAYAIVTGTTIRRAGVTKLRSRTISGCLTTVPSFSGSPPLNNLRQSGDNRDQD